MVMKAQTGSLVEPISSARTGSRSQLLTKQGFAIHNAIKRIGEPVSPYPKAALETELPVSIGWKSTDCSCPSTSISVHAPALLGLPSAGHVPAGGGDNPRLNWKSEDMNRWLWQ